MIKPTDLRNSYGDFYDWCQKLRNGDIEADTLLEWTVASIFDIKNLDPDIDRFFN